MDSYAQYDITEDDPYLIEGTTCLINQLGITNTPDLNASEEVLVKIAMAELSESPIPPTFDLKHLRSIHQHLFQDIYPFAGEPRKTEIMKGGKLFLPFSMIDQAASQVFSDLHSEGLLKGLTPSEFGSRAGYYLGRINMIHPFREGNGRTQRILLDQLASMNDYAIQWSAISGDAMALACRAARTDEPDYSSIERLISLHTTGLK